jgi:DNA-binding Lrp family transcriptional regulator
MEEKGILRDFYPLFDYTKFGYNGYFVLFRVNAFSREKLDRIVELLEDHGMVAWVSRVAGGWDLLTFFMAPNASHFNKEFKALIAQHPDQLRKYQILTTIVIHDMGRDYLTETGVQAGDIIVGGDRDVVDISAAERATCRLLNQDPQMSSVDMAEELDVTPKTVIDRTQSLEDRQLINGYRPVLGLQELDVQAYLLMVKYNNRDVDKENALRDYCIDHPNATMFMKTFGDWDAVIRLETDDREQERKVVNSIRERFEDILLDYDTLEIVDDIKKRYLPGAYFAAD